MKKKIFFIHVPKTAGSSFNTFLAKHFSGRNHCEAYLAPDQMTMLNLSELKILDYISGHLKLDTFFWNNFSKEEYFLLAFLREPVEHLISHINWVMHIHDISADFFNGHPKVIQQMSLELRSLNLYDTDSFVSSLQKYQGLFKNTQSKFFVTKPEDITNDSVVEQVSKLDMIGFTELYEESLRKFINLNNLGVEPEIHKVNQNPCYRIQKDILENDSIYNFIREYNAIDDAVYRFLIERETND